MVSRREVLVRRWEIHIGCDACFLSAICLVFGRGLVVVGEEFEGWFIHWYHCGVLDTITLDIMPNPAFSKFFEEKLVRRHT